MDRRLPLLACALVLGACAVLVPPNQRFAYDIQQGMKAMQAHRAEDAARWFDDAHAVSRSFGEHDPRAAQALNLMAWTYHARGQFVWALMLHGTALEVQKKALGPSHPDVARILATRAETYAVMGNFKDAEQDLGDAATILEAALGPGDQEVVSTKRYLEQVRRGETPRP